MRVADQSRVRLDPDAVAETDRVELKIPLALAAEDPTRRFRGMYDMIDEGMLLFDVPGVDCVVVSSGDDHATVA